MTSDEEERSMSSNKGLYHSTDAQGGRVNFTVSRFWRARERLPPP